MHCLCAYSSVEFEVTHFPGYLTSREVAHPIFSLPQKKLLSYLGRWATGTAFTPTDNYLLFLSILHSSDLVEFRVPAIRTESTPQIIAQNMEALCKSISRLNTVVNPAVVFPRYVISPETKDLSNVAYWIHNWNQAYQDFTDGYRSAHDSSKLIQREHALERLIKNPHRPVSSYAGQIADWAAEAGNFPTAITVSRLTGQRCSISDYWKQIISKCAHEDSLFAINRQDLEELLEHCETEIPIGSIFSNALFSVLRHAIKRQRNFLDIADLETGTSNFGTGYRILSPTDSVESANMQALIMSAPADKPKEKDYPSKMAYLKAKMRWEMAQKYAPGDQS
jgi:hypothetical protein